MVKNMAIIRSVGPLKESDVTPYDVYQQRRTFIKSGLAMAAMSIVPIDVQSKIALEKFSSGAFSTDEEKTPLKDITSYNNFYEFGVDKRDPARNAHKLIPDPWSVEISGEVEKPGNYALEDILQPHNLEERIYRLRCVEGWSMVIPWLGFPLADLIKRFQPTSKANYIEFTTLEDKKQMPGQRRRVLAWPYTEGLRMDEAMNPLTLMAVGLYGNALPNQNGAPIRLVVPWKYGFKSIKSIVKINFVEKMPVSSWMKSGPKEYGFYSNVNPKVPHPRWSQKKERRIGEFRKRKTLMFNGYGEQVASLYTGMDLKKHF